MNHPSPSAPPRANRCPALALVCCWLVTLPAAGVDLRGVIRLQVECSSELGRYQLTLFGNGTIRLREGLHESEQMLLAELPPEDLRAYLAELGRDDPSDGLGDVAFGGAVAGPWVERCQVTLALPGRERFHARFTRYDTPPLKVDRLVRVAGRLAALARPSAQPPGLPPDYQPAFGDVLRNAAGERYRVIGVTTDGRAVELDGLDQPLRIYVALESLAEVFVAREDDR